MPLTYVHAVLMQMWVYSVGTSVKAIAIMCRPQLRCLCAAVLQAHVAVEDAEAKAAAAERKAKAAAPSKRKRESAALVAQHAALVAVADVIPQVGKNSLLGFFNVK